MEVNVPEIRLKGFTEPWEQRKFKSLINRVSKTSTENRLPRVEFEDIISGLGQLNKDINKKDSRKSGTEFLSGDILFGKLRPYLKNWLLPDFDGVAVGDFWVFRPKESDSHFIYYLIQSDNFQAVANLSIGTKMPRSDWSVVSEAEFSIPTMAEQIAIGEYFRILDENIALHKRKLDGLKELKKGYLQKMFPQSGETVPMMRLKGFTEPWIQREWSDTVDISTNMVDPKTGDYDDLPHIGPGNIESFTGQLLDNVKTVKEDKLISGKFHFKSGDIIYGKINPQLAKYIHVGFEGLCSADAYVLNAKNGLAQSFLFNILQSKHFYNYSVSVSQRTGMPKINRDELNQFNYFAPSDIDEQTAIGNFFHNLDNQITAQSQKVEQLKQLKAAYLQKMFV